MNEESISYIIFGIIIITFIISGSIVETTRLNNDGNKYELSKPIWTESDWYYINCDKDYNVSVEVLCSI